MSELKDPAIKLFGKTIPLQEISPQRVDEANGQDMDPSFSESSVLDKEDKDITRDTTNESNQDGLPPATSEESSNPEATSGISDSTKTSSVEKENNGSKNSKTEEEQHDTSTSQEKMLKKPDKVLPCPRCNSMDTKFCYYNNYNVNQPRHFCKNCQRYWTAGGTMRNVPVGAGRRKNKNSASQYRHITVSEALQGVRADIPNGVHHPALKTNGTVLTFGSDTPLHESMASVLNLADKTVPNSSRNVFHKPEGIRLPISYRTSESSVSQSNGSPVRMSNIKDGAGKTGSDEQVMENCQRFPPQIPCFPGAPLPYPWSSAHWSSPVPQPTFCPPGFPMPFYPVPPYWGCTVPGAWNYPWLPQPSSPNQSSTSSGPNSPTLGKHSRDENTLKTSNSGEGDPAEKNTGEKSLWIPKTLRIDDPGEAAKSSIWTTLGIKNEKPDAIGGRGLFKAFQSKTNEKNHATETSSVLQANPAALSRSVQFHESS